MNDLMIPHGLDLIETAIFLVRVGDRAESMSRELLWKIEQERLWQGRFSSMKDFVTSPDGIGKSMPWLSQQKSVYKHYCLDGGLTAKDLEGISNYRLYLGIGIDGPYEERVAAAKTLSLDAMKQLVSSDKHPNCSHEDTHTITICDTCGIRI